MLFRLLNVLVCCVFKFRQNKRILKFKRRSLAVVMLCMRTRTMRYRYLVMILVYGLKSACRWLKRLILFFTGIFDQII